MSLFSLQNKVAVITGAGSGIGQAIARTLASQGATVCVLDVNEKAGQQTVDELNPGSQAQFHRCNVSDQREVNRVFSSIVGKSGRIDILVNSAGIAHVGNLENTTEDNLDSLFQVNVKGTYNTMHEAIPFMKAQGGGVILNVGSVAALVGITDRFAYSTTKGAVISMSLSVAKDYVKEGIRCNTISPARVHTPFVDGFLKKNYPGREQEMFEKLSKTQPIGRMAKPEEISYLALYLCSDEASFITGCDYPIDGGFLRLNS